ncbi:MAG: hypothetical protein B7X28_02610 [Halothiobacillus sp. 13-55-253]|nr:MAG: hypothetical protein B7X28_02610 [Halothiobacillus sp. 13-55-253]
MSTVPIKPTDILDYWYSDFMQKHWFASTPALDELALVIVLDQFPLNMFRGKPESFRTERKAIDVTLNALKKGFDKQLSKDRLSFLFMPLMHSEKLEEQDLSVALFHRYGLTGNIKFAEHHREIVRMYGRFPHRNAILGRKSIPAEIEYLASKDAFKG